jgi:hypothetical protein
MGLLPGMVALFNNFHYAEDIALYLPFDLLISGSSAKDERGPDRQ